MKNRSITIVLLLLLPALVSAQRLSPGKAIKNLEKALKEAGSMRIEFKEHYLWAFTGAEQSARGVLMLQGEDHFRAEMEGQVMVSDGTTLWSHDMAANRVVIDRMMNNEETMLPRRILFHYTEDYDLRIGRDEVINGIPCHKLLFTSSTGQTMFPEAVVWVNKETWMIVQVQQKDLNENEITYLLEKVEIKQTFSNADFSFTIPEGCEVVDMR